MAIRFTPEAKPPEAPAPDGPQAWVAPADKGQLEEGLFRFLRALAVGRAQADRPLLATGDTLPKLYAAPHRDLTAALAHLLEVTRTDIDPAGWGELTVGPAVWGVAVAAHNALTPSLSADARTADVVDGFLDALLPTLPPARTAADALAYHAVLAAPAAALPDLPPGRAAAVRALLNLSPLTAAYHVHLATPPPLTGLAAELLRGRADEAIDPAPWADRDDWLTTFAALLNEPGVTAWLRRRWLTLPETRPACRNLGLLLEGLRLRRDAKLRAVLLTFYESYCRAGWGRGWPVFGEIERLLRAGGDSEAAIRVNRAGMEYLLKFRPLIQLVIAEGGVPSEYRHLRVEMVLGLNRLLRYAPEYGGPRVSLGEIEYGGEEA